MDLENIRLSERSQTRKATHIVWFYFYKMSRTGESTERERLVITKGLRRERNEKWLLMSVWFLFGATKISEIRWWWWLHNHVNIPNLTKLYTSEEIIELRRDNPDLSPILQTGIACWPLGCLMGISNWTCPKSNSISPPPQLCSSHSFPISVTPPPCF